MSHAALQQTPFACRARPPCKTERIVGGGTREISDIEGFSENATMRVTPATVDTNIVQVRSSKRGETAPPLREGGSLQRAAQQGGQSSTASTVHPHLSAPLPLLLRDPRSVLSSQCCRRCRCRSPGPSVPHCAASMTSSLEILSDVIGWMYTVAWSVRSGANRRQRGASAHDEASAQRSLAPRRVRRRQHTLPHWSAEPGSDA